MDVNQFVEEVIGHPQLLSQHIALIENLPRDQANTLVPKLVQGFHDHKLWPKDAAGMIAACGPTDEQLLVLLSEQGESFQKLGLHVVALLIGNQDFAQDSHSALARCVIRLLQTEAFRPKKGDLRELWLWAEYNSYQVDQTNRPRQ